MMMNIGIIDLLINRVLRELRSFFDSHTRKAGMAHSVRDLVLGSLGDLGVTILDCVYLASAVQAVLP